MPVWMASEHHPLHAVGSERVHLSVQKGLNSAREGAKACRAALEQVIAPHDQKFFRACGLEGPQRPAQVRGGLKARGRQVGHRSQAYACQHLGGAGNVVKVCHGGFHHVDVDRVAGLQKRRSAGCLCLLHQGQQFCALRLPSIAAGCKHVAGADLNRERLPQRNQPPAQAARWCCHECDSRVGLGLPCKGSGASHPEEDAGNCHGAPSPEKCTAQMA
mmetsp:Transcript_22543/g.71491  ORF Transcript_22543/g.71491 Transcript_22543/m.71491 type:complete len:217 (+) Transcript_22543:997-1647(+)